MRYIEQEIEIIKAKFVGEKQTEERSPRGMSSARQALTRTPQTGQVPPAVKQNAIRPAASDVRQAPPAVTNPAPASAALPWERSAAATEKTMSTNTAVGPGKKATIENASPDRSTIAAIEEVTTPLGPEQAAEVQGDVPVPERGRAADVQEAAAPDAAGKNAPAAETESGGDAGLPTAAEKRSGDAADEGIAEDNGGTEEPAVGGESDERQSEQAIGEGEPSPVEENEEGDQAAAEDETPQRADETAAAQEGEVAGEE